MPKVNFVNEKKEIEVAAGANLRQEALKAGIQVNFHLIELGGGKLGKYLNCGGKGTCGTCQILVKKGGDNLSSKGKWEQVRLGTMLSAVGHEDDMRLACQTSVKGDCTIETHPSFNWSGETFWQKPYPNK